jgi:hypothetical protein
MSSLRPVIFTAARYDLILAQLFFLGLRVGVGVS